MVQVDELMPDCKRKYDVRLDGTGGILCSCSDDAVVSTASLQNVEHWFCARFFLDLGDRLCFGIISLADLWIGAVVRAARGSEWLDVVFGAVDRFYQMARPAARIVNGAVV